MQIELKNGYFQTNQLIEKILLKNHSLNLYNKMTPTRINFCKSITLMDLTVILTWGKKTARINTHMIYFIHLYSLSSTPQISTPKNFTTI